MNFVINKRKEILSGAMKKEDYTNANKVLDSFEDKLDMNKIDQRLTYRTEIDYTNLLPKASKLLDSADKDI